MPRVSFLGGSASSAGQLDVAVGVDGCGEEGGDYDGGFVFGDNGGAGDLGAGAQGVAVVDRDRDEFARFGVEDRAVAGGLGGR
jgi:hypothetical protein